MSITKCTCIRERSFLPAVKTGWRYRWLELQARTTAAIRNADSGTLRIWKIHSRERGSGRTFIGVTATAHWASLKIPSHRKYNLRTHEDALPKTIAGFPELTCRNPGVSTTLRTGLAPAKPLSQIKDEQTTRPEPSSTAPTYQLLRSRTPFTRCGRPKGCDGDGPQVGARATKRPHAHCGIRNASTESMIRLAH
jgi:hypothetical protein